MLTNFGLLCGRCLSFALSRHRPVLPCFSVFGVTLSLSSTSIPCRLRSRMLHLLILTPAPRVLLGSSSMSSSLERPDAPGSGSARHPNGDAGVPLAVFPVPATESILPVPRVAASYPAAELQNLSWPAATPITAGPCALHTYVGLDLYLAMETPYDVQHSCNAVVGDERRRCDTGSHVGSVLLTAAEGLLHLAPRL